MKQDNQGVPETVGMNVQCTGVHDLIDWQIVQYRKCIDEYRREWSNEQHRCVSRQEAEAQFKKMELEKMGEQWRVEYCGLVCPQREKCLLAMHFLNKHHTHMLHKVG